MSVRQLELFESNEVERKGPQPIQLFPLEDYTHVIVSFSGGKDSLASLLHLLELGVPKEKIQVWHQCCDGWHEHEKSSTDFWDWPVTTTYCTAVCQLFDIPIRFQWRDKGISGEMFRNQSRTGDVFFTRDDGEVEHLPTTRGKESTRMMWPAMSPDLRVRYCSAAGKVDVFRRVLNNHPHLNGTIKDPSKILVITGERREESPNRSRYNEAELHSCHSRTRNVHSWRPVIDWSELEIWSIIERWRVVPHPAYYLGFPRCSCAGCIFQTPDLWALFRFIAPDRFERFVRTEKELNHTLDSRMDLTTKANLGSLDRFPIDDPNFSNWAQMALNRDLQVNDILAKEGEWVLPAGANRGSAGGSF
ncbi:phosphoadenosine phosphosulfate reductase family protein [Alicyclobacillus fodiniaquatilis]|uniref:Phosphoadenosine phosphosulfate reductase family protein n=1 Tax=Alicyclobacillus fodiniaquatilis TaxID=1661150 RepID=A0ABW4JI80_9BACL